MEFYENLELLLECLRDNMSIIGGYLYIRAPYSGNPHNRLLSPTRWISGQEHEAFCETTSPSHTAGT